MVHCSDELFLCSFELLAAALRQETALTQPNPEVMQFYCLNEHKKSSPNPKIS